MQKKDIGEFSSRQIEILNSQYPNELIGAAALKGFPNIPKITETVAEADVTSLILSLHRTRKKRDQFDAQRLLLAKQLLELLPNSISQDVDQGAIGSVNNEVIKLALSVKNEHEK